MRNLRFLAFGLLAFAAGPLFLSAHPRQAAPANDTDRVPNKNLYQTYPRWTGALCSFPSDPGPGDDYAVSMAVQADGTVHALVKGPTNTLGSVAYSNNRPESRTMNGFSTPEPIGTNNQGDQAFPLDIAVALDGRVAVAYRVATSEVQAFNFRFPLFFDIYVRERSANGSWGAATKITQGSYSFPGMTKSEHTFGGASLAYDLAGKIHMIYMEEEKETIFGANSQTTITLTRKIKYSFNLSGGNAIDSGTSVTTNGIGDPADVPVFYPTTGRGLVAVSPDPSGTAHLIWMKDTSSGTKGRYSAGGGAAIDLFSSAINVDIAADEGGGVHAVVGKTFRPGYKVKAAPTQATPNPNFGALEEIPLTVGTTSVCVATDSRKKPVVVFSNNNGMTYATKVKNDGVTEPTKWVFQQGLDSQSTSFGGNVVKAAITPGNEKLHVLTDGGSIIRTAELNLGAQDGFTQIPFGPNASANIATGNLSFELPLFTARSGAGFSTSFSLIYNSMDPSPSTISPGWSTNYDVTLTGGAIVRFGDGRIVPFGNNFFSPVNVPPFRYADHEYGLFWTLTRDQPVTGQYELKTKSGIKYVFDEKGRLAEMKDTNQNNFQLSYQALGSGGAQVLKTLTDSMNRQTTLNYDGNGRLASITDPLNRTYTLGYKATSGQNAAPGKLETVKFDGATGPEVKWKFEYYETTDETLGQHKELMSKLFTPGGRISDYSWDFRYKLDGRVISSEDPSAPSVTSEGNIDAGPVSTRAKREILYNDPAEPFDKPNDQPASGTDRKVPKVTIKDRRGFETKIELEYRRCLADRIEDAQSPTGVTERRFQTVTGIFDSSGIPSTRPTTRNLVRFKDPRGAWTKYEYFILDPQNNPDSIVLDNLKQIFRAKGLPPNDPDNAGSYLPPINYTYSTDGLNRVLSVEDSRGLTTNYTYAAGTGNLQAITYPDGFSDHFLGYDRGRVTLSRDANLNVTGYSFDSQTGLVSGILRSGAGGNEVFGYDKMGNVTLHAAAGMGFASMFYDGLYRLSTQTAATTGITQYGYDVDSNLLTSINALTNSTENTYDSLGRLTLVTNSLSGTMAYSYDREGNVRRVKDFNSANGGASSKTVYDEVGRVKQSQSVTTSPVAGGGLGLTTAVTNYDLAGNLTSQAIVGQVTQETIYSYDARGNLLNAIHPIATLQDAYEYDNNDNRTVSFRIDTALLGHAFQYGTAVTYDGRNRATATTALTLTPSGGLIVGLTTLFTLDGVGNRTEVKDPSNRITKTFYDAQNRVDRIEDHFGFTVEKYEYNDAGQRTKVKILSPVTGQLVDHRTYVYNSAQQLEMEIDALAHATTYAYDLNGNLTLKTDAKNVKTKLVYDVLDRLIDEIVDFGGLNLTTHYEYDSNGNRTLVRDPRGKTYTYAYDAANRLAKLTYPGGSFETWIYDDNGRMASHTDRAGSVTSYVYDLNNRLLNEVHGFPYNVTIQRGNYDGFGNPHSIDDGKVKILNDYDELGRQISSSWSIRNGQGTLVPFKSVSYGYDNSSNRQYIIDPETVTTTYGYDLNNRLQSITRGSQVFATFGYDAGGRLTDTSYTQAGGTTVHRTYNNRLDLTNIRTTSPVTGVLASCTYGYDEVGNRTSETRDDLGVVKGYTYDRAYRLTGEAWTGNDGSSAGFTNAFTDLTGANESAPSNEVSAVPLSAVTVAPYLALYEYDGAGNRTRKQTSDGTSVYHYDDLNQLQTEDQAGVTPLGSLTATGSSTQAGFIVAKVVDGQTADGQTSAQAWRSVEAATVHEVTVNLGASTTLTRITVTFPSGLGDIQQFKLQVLGGSGYADLSGAVALGAEALSNPAGYWRTTSRQATFTFPELTASAVKFVQAVGGGPLATPNVAWLTEIQLYGGAPALAVSYEYDANGNQKKRTQGAVVETFLYDYQFRLSSYVKATSGSETSHVTYAYTPSGERYQKQVLARQGASVDELSSFMYDGADVVTDYLQVNGATTPQLQVTYVQGLSIDSKVARITAGTTPQVHYYVPDALGSVIQLVDAAQAVVNQNLTTAWGEPRSGGSSTVADRHGFTQRENDDNEGITYFRARGYDARTGRFLQIDPEFSQRVICHYSYCRNQPTQRIDPRGAFSYKVSLNFLTQTQLAEAAAADGQANGAALGYTEPAITYQTAIDYDKRLPSDFSRDTERRYEFSGFKEISMTFQTALPDLMSLTGGTSSEINWAYKTLKMIGRHERKHTLAGAVFGDLVFGAAERGLGTVNAQFVDNGITKTDFNAAKALFYQPASTLWKQLWQQQEAELHRVEKGSWTTVVGGRPVVGYEARYETEDWNRWVRTIASSIKFKIRGGGIDLTNLFQRVEDIDSKLESDYKKGMIKHGIPSDLYDRLRE